MTGAVVTTAGSAGEAGKAGGVFFCLCSASVSGATVTFGWSLGCPFAAFDEDGVDTDGFPRAPGRRPAGVRARQRQPPRRFPPGRARREIQGRGAAAVVRSVYESAFSRPCRPFNDRSI